MSIGVGLGAFVQGMNAGISARDRIDTQRENRANKKALGMIDTDRKSVV